MPCRHKCTAYCLQATPSIQPISTGSLLSEICDARQCASVSSHSRGLTSSAGAAVADSSIGAKFSPCPKSTDPSRAVGGSSADALALVPSFSESSASLFLLSLRLMISMPKTTRLIPKKMPTATPATPASLNFTRVSGCTDSVVCKPVCDGVTWTVTTVTPPGRGSIDDVEAVGFVIVGGGNGTEACWRSCSFQRI